MSRNLIDGTSLSDLAPGLGSTAPCFARAGIADVNFCVRETNPRYPVYAADNRASSVFHVIGRIRTRDGSCGVGHAFSFKREHALVICRMAEELATLELRQGTVADPVAAWKQTYASIAFIGHAGISMMALSILDAARWDALGHVVDLSLVEMLGGQVRQLTAYGSDRLWLGDRPAELARSVSEMADQGFEALKLRVGGPDLSSDLARVRAACSALPDDVQLLVDVNQAWDLDRAIRGAAELAQLGVGWLEEPVRSADWEGLAEVGESAPGLRLAGGEGWYGPDSLRALEVSKLDVFMPDLQRMGGVTPWIIAAREALRRGHEVSPHLFPEVSCSLVAGLGIPAGIEYVSWFRELFSDCPDLDGGVMTAPAGPGLGVRLAAGVMGD